MGQIIDSVFRPHRRQDAAWTLESFSDLEFGTLMRDGIACALHLLLLPPSYFACVLGRGKGPPSANFGWKEFALSLMESGVSD